MYTKLFKIIYNIIKYTLPIKRKLEWGGAVAMLCPPPPSSKYLRVAK
jgi:hypothetical protein